MRHERIAIARITRIHDNPHSCYRAELLDPLDPTEHIMLRDSDTLDQAVERVTAHHTRHHPTVVGDLDESVA